MPRLLFSFALLATLACGAEPGPVFAPSDGPLPDFALADVNPGSSSYQRTVSPRAQLQKISAWYFGHAT